jgi:phosphoglycerate kinase
MKLRSIRNVDLAGKRVLTRVDFNVPLFQGEVADDSRVAAAVPTIAYMLHKGAKVILCSHLGRPGKQVVEGMRLAPVAPVLERLLNSELEREGLGPVSVLALKDCIGPEVQQAIAAASPGQVVLLENLRFYAGEEANDAAFAGELAKLGDIYVSDAFGTVHRGHASTEGVAHLLPAYAGFLVEQEVAALAQVTQHPEHPFVIVMGGAKISDKIDVLENLIPKADIVLIGGAMANTFLRAQGFSTGKSLVEEEQLKTAAALVRLADDSKTMLLLPTDYMVTDDIHGPTRIRVAMAHEILENDIVADIGPQTIESYREALMDARTVFWNGPLGVFEQEQFAKGTLAIAQALSSIYESAHTVVGGGESVSAVHKAGVANRIHHISTGGGASLEFVAGYDLPGLKVLMEG